MVIKAPQTRVFDALTTLRGLRAWWENPVKGSPAQGEEIRFEFDESDNYGVMHVDLAERPSTVRWSVIQDTGYNGEWVGTKILFELKRLGPKRTELRFRHLGLTPKLASYEDCRSGWDYFIGNIVKHSERT